MAIDLSNLVEKYKLDIKGILHIGAHQGDSLYLSIIRLEYHWIK